MPATGIEALITEALLTRLQSLALTPAVPVAYPDVVFPAADQVRPDTYLEANVLRAETAPVGIARWDERRGILQVDVVYNTTAGPLTPTNIADAIAAWFPRNTRLTNGSVQVDIYETPSIASVIADDPYKRIPVSIRYRSFTA